MMEARRMSDSNGKNLGAGGMNPSPTAPGTGTPASRRRIWVWRYAALGLLVVALAATLLLQRYV